MSIERSPAAAADVLRLLDAAHATICRIDPQASARRLYLDAASVAERRIPGPLGVAVAGVLAIAAEKRRVSGLRGSLGEHTTTLALALAVLDLPAAAGEGT